MFVLCRTRAQARKITQALIAANLPVIERGGLLEQEHIKNLLSIVMLLAEPSGMGIVRAARQPDHLLTQSDIEALLLAAREQKSSPVKLMLRDEASPPVPLSIFDGEGEGGEAGSPLQAMSIDGRRSLARLATMLKALYLTPNIWSLLVDYLFIETSLVRGLLTRVENAQARAVLADYAGILQLARYFDQQQQALRLHKEQDAFARGEDAAAITLPAIQEQARSF